MEEKSVFDNMGEFEMLRELVKFFGAERTIELMGWAVLWGLTGVKSVNDLRHRLEEQGFSKSSTYRAASDLRRWKEHLEAKRGQPISLNEAVQEINTIRGSSQ
jgi:hypothetical protein